MPPAGPAAIDDVLIALERGRGASTSARRTLQAQIADGLRDAIARGRIAPGTRLPGTRTLAGRLGVSRTTAALALEALVAEGFAIARPRSGRFVADEPPRAPARVPRSAEAAARGLAVEPPRLSRHARAQVRGSDARTNAPPPVAFPLSRPALDAFPIDTWSRLLSRRAARTSVGQLDYGTGVPALARAIAALVSAARGVRVEPAQVIVVGGARRAIELAAAALVDPGDTVTVEDPGYPGARRAFTAAGARVIPVRVDRDGLDVGALPRRARLAYVTPACQFPLGATMTLARRRALLAWAARAGAFVLEDDYDADFRFAGAPPPPLVALDAGAGGSRVVLVGSFSRTMFPSMRLGYLIAPPGLADAFHAVRAVHEDPPPSLLQLALADFIDGGHYVHHLRRMRVLYRARRDALAAAATAAGLAVRATSAGLHLVCDLPRGVDARAIARAARAGGVEVAPLAEFQVRGRAAPALVLGFGSVPPRRVRAAMAVIAQAIASA